nr:MAG TPA: hypothetical protein [Caudoviricetes sp.]
MLKQFNLNGLYFDAPRITLGNEIKTVSGEGWYPVETQDDVDGIWQSVESDGEVWVENDNLKWSGPPPSDNHRWVGDKKQWVELNKKEKNAREAEVFAQKQAALLQSLNTKVAELKTKHLSGYSVREEQEARGLLPTMLLDEIFAASGYSSMDELKAAIIAKAETLAIIEGTIIATESDLKSRIANAKSMQELDLLSAEIAKWH